MRYGDDRRQVVLYELNEVPWEIIDLFIAQRPSSNVASLVHGGRCQTTRNEDPNHLSPWRTWPTFHKARYSDHHNCFELGQDPSTFRGLNLWDVAEEEGLKVGLFGVLQSWPPRPFANGGFYVPDTFSPTPEAEPASLRRFQGFNLDMTRRMAFSPDVRLHPGRILLAGVDIALKGLTPWSGWWAARQLLRERRDERYKACRSIVQVLPSFDLYWRLHRRHDPDLSIFFTNHVAGMMHRFWGDLVPRYAEQNDYRPDEVFKTFVMSAMEVFDHQLGRLMRFADRNPATLLLIAGSMGQTGIPYQHIGETYVLEDAQRLSSSLGLDAVVSRLAMYPMQALELADEERAEDARRLLTSITVAGRPLMTHLRVEGRTLSFAVRMELEDGEVRRDIEYTTSTATEPRTGTIGDIGVGTATRLGGGNTAYHSPEGILITYGDGIPADGSREQVSILDAGPAVLAHLGVADPRKRLTSETAASR